MKIKRLEIKGFKSFPDRTVLELKPGITAAVGPNGCGKSNIMEAIRWVMGEQRARSLRGKKMEDIIFNGSEKRKPVGMAEVRMTLSNTDGMSPPAMADYDEIMITRRLFRDGDSQYEINNILCRLSDITDFFLDTGVGKNSYAIIEQGRVDMVVASKPEDRRVLIEEAAGISRYKARREEALKKLELTNQNLQRISDVINEVRRQAAAVKRQAAKAERYRKLSEQLRSLDTAFHAFRVRGQADLLGRLQAEIEKCGASLLTRETSVASLQSGLEKARLASLETERILKDVREARHGTEMALASLRGNMERDRNRIAHIKDRQARAHEEIAALTQRIEEVSRGLQESQASRSSVQQELDEAAKALQAALAESPVSAQELKRQRTGLDQLKDAIFQALQDGARKRNRREHLKKRGHEIAGSLARIAGEIESLAPTLERDSAEHDLMAETLDQCTRNRKGAEERKARLVAERNALRADVAALRDHIGREERNLASARARLESLEEMQRGYTGYEHEVRFLMENRSLLGEGRVLGPLAELIEVAPEYEKALVAALGEQLSHIVVSSPRVGVAAAQQLKEADAGRSTFLPLTPRCIPEVAQCDPPAGPVPLQDKVRFRDGCGHLGEFLLKDCFVVEDMKTALELWERNGIMIDLVTAAGDLITRHGEITGGSRQKAQEDLFGKRREREELSKKVASLELAASDLRASLLDEEEYLRELDEEILASDRVINERALEDVHLRKDRERLAAQIAGSRRREQVLGLERAQHEKEDEALAGELERAESAVVREEARWLELEQERDQVSREVTRLAEVIEEQTGRTSELRVRVAQLEERGRSLDRECRTLAENRAVHERRYADFRGEQSRHEDELERLTLELDDAAVGEGRLMAEHASRSGKIASMTASHDEHAHTVTDLEEQLSVHGREISGLREQLHGLEMDAVRAEQTMDNLVEKMVERYHIDPRTVEPPGTPPDESEISDLRTRLEGMGEVNLAAIAESRHLEERLSFLQEQEEDLKKAVDSLYATINAINRTTRERFRAAFDTINGKFREIFPYLFRGGEASLVLTDEEDLLETGVDIIARPPGKRVRNMDLLSGGEKALTAVALIFSIFLTKPSPFCLLDEVDAPLDDANLDRFNDLLRELSHLTQFIIITHNKRSMQEADSLYGVTMGEPGASSVVSVHFAV